jgi:hypothetical protein
VKFKSIESHIAHSFKEIAMKNRSNGLRSTTPFRLSLLGLLLLPLALTPALTYGQGMRYLDLLRQKRQQQVFIDQLALPTAQPDDVQLVTVIKIHYPFLSFKKNSGSYNQNGPKSFYAPAGFNVELFNIPKGEKPPKKHEDLMELNMTKYNSAARSAWQDTAFASSYESTQDKAKYLVGYTKTTVPAGSYYYLFSLNRPDSNTPATPMRKHINLTASDDVGHAGFVFLDDAKDSSNGLPLIADGQ